MNRFLIISAVLALLFVSSLVVSSCGKKESQSNLTAPIDEEKKFALTLYGDEVKVLAKGDLLSNGKQAAIVGVVRQQTSNSYWIQKGSFIQKESDGWKVLLKMEEKLSSPKGNLVEQIDSKNGYIISFDTSKQPITINIVMANEYGKGASDDAAIKWNKDKESFEFVAPFEDMPQ